MKVLIIGSVYPRFEEDNEVPWLRKSVETLRHAHVDVEVLAPSYKGLKTHTIDGVPVHRFRYAPKNLEILTHDEGAPTKMAKHPSMQLLAIPYCVSGFFKCLWLAKTKKVDVIHAHWPFPPCADRSRSLQAFSHSAGFEFPWRRAVAHSQKEVDPSDHEIHYRASERHFCKQPFYRF